MVEEDLISDDQANEHGDEATTDPTEMGGEGTTLVMKSDDQQEDAIITDVTSEQNSTDLQGGSTILESGGRLGDVASHSCLPSEDDRIKHPALPSEDVGPSKISSSGDQIGDHNAASTSSIHLPEGRKNLLGESYMLKVTNSGDWNVDIEDEVITGTLNSGDQHNETLATKSVENATTVSKAPLDIGKAVSVSEASSTLMSKGGEEKPISEVNPSVAISNDEKSRVIQSTEETTAHEEFHMTCEVKENLDPNIAEIEEVGTNNPENTNEIIDNSEIKQAEEMEAENLIVVSVSTGMPMDEESTEGAALSAAAELTNQSVTSEIESTNQTLSSAADVSNQSAMSASETTNQILSSAAEVTNQNVMSASVSTNQIASVRVKVEQTEEMETQVSKSKGGKSKPKASSSGVKVLRRSERGKEEKIEERKEKEDSSGNEQRKVKKMQIVEEKENISDSDAESDNDETSAPGEPSERAATSSSITIAWEPPRRGISNVEYYEVKYRESGRKRKRWTSCFTEERRESFTVTDLPGDTKFEFKVKLPFFCIVGLHDAAKISVLRG